MKKETFQSIPKTGLERYPEFEPLVNTVVELVLNKIHFLAPNVESEMPYKRQLVLEEVIRKLQGLV